MPLPGITVMLVNSGLVAPFVGFLETVTGAIPLIRIGAEDCCSTAEWTATGKKQVATKAEVRSKCTDFMINPYGDRYTALVDLGMKRHRAKRQRFAGTSQF
uniref:Uncharacterized protein n=1 Tax=mine drainage metagenome TaxID=410659 RepID=E6QJR5_9ZZZZ